MNANELMVGNIVSYDGMTVYVNQVNKTKIEGLIDKNDLLIDIRFNVQLLEPIPITEEFLERNGFILDDDIDGVTEEKFYLLKLDKFTITIHEGSNTIGRDWWIHIDNEDHSSIAGADIQYVHHFQNLLNIMNIEFDIKL